MFHLTYKKLLIGILSHDGTYWHFSYSDEFRKQSEFSVLIQFPDKDGNYKAQDLWPFFSLRIPSVKQPKIMEIIASEGIDPTDQKAMLARFGKRCIQNPFILTLQEE
jgi:hypothetical protein